MPADDLRLALEAAREAGEIVRSAFVARQEVRYKAPDQPVTGADLAADRRLREILGAARPEYGWLSEETADDRARLARRRVWVVDPIDGTTSLLAGRPELAVCVALVEEGTPVVGVVYNPLSGEIYHAVRGAGAFRDGRPIRVAAAAGEPVLLVSAAERARGAMDGFEGPWRIAELGSTAYKMAKVADGTAQAYASVGCKHEWDVCAAALLVEEAGGRALQLDGSALRYNQADTRVRGTIALGGLPPLLAEALLRRGVQSSIQERRETNG